jgi:hypothetical protein
MLIYKQILGFLIEQCYLHCHLIQIFQNNSIFYYTKLSFKLHKRNFLKNEHAI